jgi:hypothetical protein
MALLCVGCVLRIVGVRALQLERHQGLGCQGDGLDWTKIAREFPLAVLSPNKSYDAAVRREKRACEANWLAIKVVAGSEFVKRDRSLSFIDHRELNEGFEDHSSAERWWWSIGRSPIGRLVDPLDFSDPEIDG